MGLEIPQHFALEEQVFSPTNEKEFLEIALSVFSAQFESNPVYAAFCNALRRTPASVSDLTEIPFLPISAFKTHDVCSGSFIPEAVFESSGTTGMQTSRHLVKDLNLYEKSFLTAFHQRYGAVADLCILGLLPSYLERGQSSLVYMVDQLVKRSGQAESGFYLYDHAKLAETLRHLESKGQKTILFGVSYALLDFAEQHSISLQHTVVVETGGMKGRRREMAKEEMYDTLRTAFSTSDIHAEYGMTELMSQAYAINGLYQSPPWMKVMLREETDPLSYTQKTGAVNIIDLANLYSCSFIATDDRGRLHSDGGFEILGRLDHSDIRGCSQLIAEL